MSDAERIAQLIAALRDDNPVVFLEDERLYGLKGEVPDGEHLVPIGVSALVREGAEIDDPVAQQAHLLDGLCALVGAEVAAAAASKGTGAAIASAYLEFAVSHPTLYWLMAERRFDRPELLRQNRLSLGPLLWGSFVALVERHGGSAVDAQLLFATLHGLVSLHASGRGNLGDAPFCSGECAMQTASSSTYASIKKNAKDVRFIDI